MFCTKCGHKVENEAKFCMNCGNQIGEVGINEEKSEIKQKKPNIQDTTDKMRENLHTVVDKTKDVTRNVTKNVNVLPKQQIWLIVASVIMIVLWLGNWVKIGISAVFMEKEIKLGFPKTTAMLFGIGGDDILSELGASGANIKTVMIGLVLLAVFVIGIGGAIRTIYYTAMKMDAKKGLICAKTSAIINIIIVILVFLLLLLIGALLREELGMFSSAIKLQLSVFAYILLIGSVVELILISMYKKQAQM